jgi:hypothetical protein
VAPMTSIGLTKIHEMVEMHSERVRGYETRSRFMIYTHSAVFESGWLLNEGDRGDENGKASCIMIGGDIV